MLVSHPSDAMPHKLLFMDRAHQEFIRLLARVGAADDTQLESAWRALVSRTSDMFARENAQMEASRFASRDAHEVQHRMVLAVMREGLLQAGEGRLLQVRNMGLQLGAWYGDHLRRMDTALARHLLSEGLDAVSGNSALPRAQRRPTPQALRERAG